MTDEELRNYPEFDQGYKAAQIASYKNCDNNNYSNIENEIAKYAFYRGWENAIQDKVTELTTPFLIELRKLCESYSVNITSGCGCCGGDTSININGYSRPFII